MPRLLVAFLILAAVAANLPANAVAESATESTAVDARPNIVLILTDDMAASDMRWMPRTRQLLGGAGVTMGSFLSNHPLCCPARAEIMSGQYAQNSGTWHNQGPWGGSQSFPYHDTGLASWLNTSGYRTAFVGKYLNEWEKDRFRPGGWTDFDAFTRKGYEPMGFSSYNNGHPVRHDNIYTADWVAERTSDLIGEYSASDAPFFIYAAQVPPHGMSLDGRWRPAVPAARHAHLFGDVVSPATRKPSFNVAGRFSRERSISVANSNRGHRSRIRSLQAVDEATASIIAALRDAGELANTYVVFTSDNGYLLGEHRITSKDLPYSEALEVPLLVRGPGIPAGRARNAMGSLVDLAPTIAAAAGATPALTVDGRSLLRLWRKGAGAGGTTTLIQSGDVFRRWDWRGVRTHRYTYIRLPGRKEILFDRRVDPYEIRNYAKQQPGRVAQLRDRYNSLKACAGQDCVTASG